MRDLVCAREQFRVRSSRRQVVLGDFTNRFLEVPVLLVVSARLTCGLVCILVRYLATMVIVSVRDLLDLLIGDRREVLLLGLSLWLLLLSQELRDTGVLWQRLLSRWLSGHLWGRVHLWVVGEALVVVGHGLLVVGYRVIG